MAFFSGSPGQEKLFSLLQDSAAIICEACLIMLNIDHKAGRYELSLLNSLEKRGENLLARTVSQISRQFVLPFDAEDILLMAEELNLGLINIVQAAKKILAYQPHSPVDKELPVLIEIADSAARDIYQLTAMLKKHRTQTGQIRKKCAEISRKKRQSDSFCLDSLVSLLNSENPEVLNILKLSDIYASFQSAHNGFDRLANIIKRLTIKYV